MRLSRTTNNLCLATAGVTIYLSNGLIAFLIAGHVSPNNHHLSLRVFRRTLSRFGFTFSRTYLIGRRYEEAVAKVILVPKSMIHLLRKFPVISDAFLTGLITSLFGLLLGLLVSSKKIRAVFSSTSNGPTLLIPWKDSWRFSFNFFANVRFVEEVKSELIAVTRRPSRMRCFSVPSSKPIMETLTAAPFKIQGRSLQAMKMSPVCLILFKIH